jgi:hypothetical protein
MTPSSSAGHAGNLGHIRSPASDGSAAGADLSVGFHSDRARSLIPEQHLDAENSHNLDGASVAAGLR